MSEQKLKALKVVDLKDILSKAAVSIPPKANKQDLIARILANPAALDVYKKLQNPNATAPPVQQTSTADDLLAPPEDFDWEGDVTASAVPPASKVQSSKPPAAESTKPAKPTKPASKSAAKPPPSPPKKPTVVAAPAQVAVEPPKDDAVDEELEKRKKRAARFGVPLVESPKPKPRAEPAQPAKSRPTTPRKASGTPTAPMNDPEKLKAREARFGAPKPANTNTSPKNPKKRPAEEEVDAEELEKRRKRAARFGMPMPNA